MTAPCEWPIDESCLPDSDSLDAGILSDAQSMASGVLWALSGRQYGVCETTARPCPQSYPVCGRRYIPTSYEVFSWAEVGWSLTGCGCYTNCRLSGPGVVHLPGPAVEVLSVVIAGEELDDTEYILEGNALYRVDGVWPSQDMTQPSGASGTWSVTYTRGVPIPAGVGRLTALLTMEFYNACTGGKCRLPRTVMEVTRQGVTHRIVNPNEIYSVGKTGIPEIDLWLSAVNPHHLLSAPSVT